MQSNGARALLALTAVVIVVVGFLILRGEDSEVGVGSADPPAVVPGQADSAAAGGQEGKPAGGPKPKLTDALTTIVVTDGAPADGVADLEYQVGDQIRFAVESDAADEVHVHGYDIEEAVGAGETVEFDFPADLDGIYEVEMHDSATPIAELAVNP